MNALFRSVGTGAVLLFLIPLLACSRPMKPARQFGEPVPVDASPHPVIIHQPSTLGVLDTPVKDVHGVSVGVSCKTCHGSEKAGALLDDEAPEDFHRGLKLEHGSLNCNSCHDQSRTGLHLADGSRLEFDQTMTLCAQCHGVQHRDYQKGSHGGMTGYWDLKRGPRRRNTCVDCHAPHSPAYRAVMPVHPPKDRFLDWTRHPDTEQAHPKGESHD